MTIPELLSETIRFWGSGAATTPVTALVAAFVFGQLLAWTYEFTFEGLSYSRGFSHTIVLVCLNAGILVLAMQHSLLAGLGLFGVLSMIRFRTDLKTSRDLVFVMAGACIGVACGVGAIVTATVGAVVFSLVSLYLSLSPFGARSRFDGVLRFLIPPAGEEGPTLKRMLRRHCLRTTLLSVTETDLGREHVYQVKLLRRSNHAALITELREECMAQDTRLLLQDAASEY